MKYSLDTYRLYLKETHFHYAMRIRVTMKEKVSANILRKSVNEAILRYPYFAKQVAVDDEGGFVLEPNNREIVVVPVGRKASDLCSEEVNGHFCYVVYQDKTIYFNMSHSLCGGKGVQPWVMTNVYQYVKNKYQIEPNAPGIRKIGEAFLEGEIEEPTWDMLSNEEAIYKSESKNPVMLYGDYINGLFNPFLKDASYRLYTFKQKDIIRFAKENDASVQSFFTVAIAKMLDKALPEKYPVIGAKVAHNPSEDIGLPYSYKDLLSHIYIDYERDMLKWDMEKLGIMTRGQILLQKDPSNSSAQLKKLFTYYEGIDQAIGLKNKMEYAAKNNFGTGKGARKNTFICNYSGRVDWGEVAQYIEDYAIIVEGHIVCEITSLADKIFLMLPQVMKTDKYANALNEVWNELGIPFELEGPFPKLLPRHKLPMNYHE